MNDWEIVKDNVERSKIKRFNYKDILGESLTSFVTRFKLLGFNSKEIKQTIMGMHRVKFFLLNNPSLKNEFIKNVGISVSSRCAEQNTINKIKNGKNI